MVTMEKPTNIMYCSGPDAHDFGDFVYDAITSLADQEAGEVAEWDLWAARFDRFIAYIDNYGTRWACAYRTKEIAMAVMDNIDKDYNAFVDGITDTEEI